MNKQEKPSPQRQSYSEPLIWLPQISIAIFHDKIIEYSKSRQKPISSNNLTLATLKDLEQPDKVVSFKDDIAFKTNQPQRKITMVKIQNERSELEFKVGREAQFAAVQEILRRKICEIGFQDKFRVVRELGKGATARVYLIERITDNRHFAAKIMPLKAESKDYETFVNQSKILRSLKSPYIVSVQSLYISKKELISVLQYLQGGTLLQQLKNDLIKQDNQKLKAIKDIAVGLQHLRQKRIVHRDLKLQNIMVRINKDKSKDYVITDFGLACWIGEKDLLYQKCGTPGYIAPEILRANKMRVIVSHGSDVFSFGIIAHFILTLRAVFPYNGDPKELLAINKKAVFSLQTKRHEMLLSSELRLLQKTLAIEPQKRTNSRELLDVYIKEYEREVAELEKKKQATKRSTKIEIEPNSSARKNLMKLNNSIEAIEKRVPSVDKSSFQAKRYKTEQQHKDQPHKKENSVGKMLSKVWSRLTSSKSDVMKKKEETTQRKTEMKNYLF